MKDPIEKPDICILYAHGMSRAKMLLRPLLIRQMLI